MGRGAMEYRSVLDAVKYRAPCRSQTPRAAVSQKSQNLPIKQFELTAQLPGCIVTDALYLTEKPAWNLYNVETCNH